MADQMFGINDGFKIWNTFCWNFHQRIPNPSKNFEAVKLVDSGHTDQGDLVYYDNYAASFINSLFGQSFYKSGGSNHEFQEALTLIWINYLYKIGLHDETFQPDWSERHINQFKEHFDFIDFSTST
jgi:hypothetical protein